MLNYLGSLEKVNFIIEIVIVFGFHQLATCF